MSRRDKSIQTESRLVVARSLSGVGMEVTGNGHEISFYGKENVLKLDYGYGCIAL